MCLYWSYYAIDHCGGEMGVGDGSLGMDESAVSRGVSGAGYGTQREKFNFFFSRVFF